MLRAGDTSTIKFNVDINGSGAPPEVRVVLNVGDHELGFKCVKVGDEWSADVKIPPDTEPGMYDMRVEVAINNRLFVPVKRKIEIGGQEIQVAATMEAELDYIPPKTPEPTPVQPVVPPPPAPLPIVEPAQPEVVHPEPRVESIKVVKEMGRGGPTLKVIPKRDAKPTAPAAPLIKSFTPASPPAVKKSIVAPLVPKPTQPKPAPVKKIPLNIPPQNIQLKGKVEPVRAKPKIVLARQPVLEAGPIRISISDIVEESNKRFGDLHESPSYQKPTTNAAAFNLSHGTPVSLIKGAVVYE